MSRPLSAARVRLLVGVCGVAGAFACTTEGGSPPGASSAAPAATGAPPASATGSAAAVAPSASASGPTMPVSDPNENPFLRISGTVSPPSPWSALATKVPAAPLTGDIPYLPRCDGTVCKDPLVQSSRFASSICKEARSSITWPLVFDGFVADGGGAAWQGPFTDDAGRTYYSAYTDTRDGTAAKQWTMQGLRYKVSRPTVAENGAAVSPIRRQNRFETVWTEPFGARATHLDRTPDPFSTIYASLPLTSNDRAGVGVGWTVGAVEAPVLSSMRTDKSPETQGLVTKCNGAFPSLTPYDGTGVARYRLLVNGKVEFDSNEFLGDPFVQPILDAWYAHPTGESFRLLKRNDLGRSETKWVAIATNDDVRVEVWPRLRLNARAAWNAGLNCGAHPGHSLRAHVDSTPRDFWMDPATTGVRSPQDLDNSYNLWNTYQRGGVVKLVGTSNTFGSSGYRVTPQFTPVLDSYELSFDRTGDLAVPSNPWVLEETMPAGWTLTRYERGLMEAQGPRPATGTTPTLRLEWADTSPRITLYFTSAQGANVSAEYYPSSPSEGTRHVTVPSRWGPVELDMGPSGHFDWQGTTVFEIAETSSNMPYLHYPVERSHDYLASIPARLPTKITVKFLPRHLLRKL